MTGTAPGPTSYGAGTLRGPTNARRRLLGSIRSGLFISLDRVIESPETWHFDYWNDEMGAAIGALMDIDVMLLGRTTYDGFAEYLLKADPDDPMSAQMNSSQMYVVSNTLTEAT